MRANIKTLKFKDWTGKCNDPEAVKMMHFALDKQNIFYVSTPNSLSAIQLDKLELNYDKLSLNAIMGT